MTATAIGKSSSAAGIWPPKLKRAWKLPRKLTVGEWAAEYRRLGRSDGAAFGRMRHERAPYLVGIMNAPTIPGIEQVWIEKSAQIGASEAVRSWIGYCAEREPDPMLIVWPDEDRGREIIADRIIPLFEGTPVLADLSTGIARDKKLSRIQLANGFVLRLGYSGSPASLASHPCRYIVCDEVDKFAAYSGREADPISLAEERTKTYPNRTLVFISTPTTEDGPIHVGRTGCAIQLRYYVPCTYCRHWQQLVFDRLRWAELKKDEDRKTHAERIEATDGAWYECVSCGRKLREKQKVDMVRRGRWATEEDAGNLAKLARKAPMGGIVRGKWPQANRIGMHINELYSIFAGTRWSMTAAAWLRSQGEPEKIINFRNSKLGEPAREQIASYKMGQMEAKCQVEWPDQVLPNWAQMLICTVDVQLDYVYFVIRAHGYARQSRRIHHGRLSLPQHNRDAWRALYDFAFGNVWRFEDEGRQGLICQAIGIDAKYRTEEVYAFHQMAPMQVFPMVGSDKQQAQLVNSKPYVYKPGKRDMRVYHHLVDIKAAKDRLAGQLAATISRADGRGEVIEEDLWQLNSRNDPEYSRQMTSEHLVRKRRGNAKPIEIWVPKVEKAANHYWDCEVMQGALHWRLNGDLIPQPDPEAIQPMPEEQTNRLLTPSGQPYLVTER